jgi:hypothetical protein
MSGALFEAFSIALSRRQGNLSCLSRGRRQGELVAWVTVVVESRAKNTSAVARPKKTGSFIDKARSQEQGPGRTSGSGKRGETVIPTAGDRTIGKPAPSVR